MMKHKAELSISRPSYGDGREKMSIQITDEDSKTRFIELEIDLSEFTKALTGLVVSCDMETNKLERIGKKQEAMKIEFELPKAHYHMSKESIIDHGKLNTPEGWVCSNYYGSQNSFRYEGGKCFARTSALRWVDKYRDSEEPK
jgi:hypothetical protein